VVSVSSVTAVFDNKNAGQNKALTISGGTLTGSDSSNYTASISGSTAATITAKAVTLTAPAITKTYDGGLTYTTTAANLTSLSSQLGVSGDTVTAVTLAFTDKNAGSANKTVTPSAATISDGNSGNNYTITYANNTASTINKATVGLSASKVYDGSTSLTGYVTITTGVGSETLTYSGATVNDRNVTTDNKFINGINLVDATDSSGGLASNYQLPTLNATNAPVTITTKSLTITADARSTTYGTALVLGTTAYTQVGLEASVDSITGVTIKHGANTTVPVTQAAGTYTNEIIASGATGSGLSNYSIAYVANTLTVNQKTLTITADARSTTYGTALALGTTGFTQVGLVNSDSITGVTLKHVTNTTVPATQFAGTYTNEIVVSAATGTGLANYSIVYTPNTLTVNKYTISINAPNVTKVYDGSVAYSASSADLTAMSAGLKNGDTISAATINYANKNVSAGNKVVTLDAITLSDGNSGNNYQVTLLGN
jgi:hypothetical protein